MSYAAMIFVALSTPARQSPPCFWIFKGIGRGEEGSTATEAHAPDGTIPAMDVIEVDGEFKKLAQQLLGNVFIAIRTPLGRVDNDAR